MPDFAEGQFCPEIVPPEIWGLIFLYLSHMDILHIRLLCKSFNQFVEQYWQTTCIRQFITTLPHPNDLSLPHVQQLLVTNGRRKTGARHVIQWMKNLHSMKRESDDFDPTRFTTVYHPNSVTSLWDEGYVTSHWNYHVLVIPHPGPISIQTSRAPACFNPWHIPEANARSYLLLKHNLYQVILAINTYQVGLINTYLISDRVNGVRSIRSHIMYKFSSEFLDAHKGSNSHFYKSVRFLRRSETAIKFFFPQTLDNNREITGIWLKGTSWSIFRIKEDGFYGRYSAFFDVLSSVPLSQIPGENIVDCVSAHVDNLMFIYTITECPTCKRNHRLCQAVFRNSLVESSQTWYIKSELYCLKVSDWNHLILGAKSCAILGCTEFCQSAECEQDINGGGYLWAKYQARREELYSIQLDIWLLKIEPGHIKPFFLKALHVHHSLSNFPNFEEYSDFDAQLVLAHYIKRNICAGFFTLISATAGQSGSPGCQDTLWFQTGIPFTSNVRDNSLKIPKSSTLGFISSISLNQSGNLCIYREMGLQELAMNFRIK